MSDTLVIDNKVARSGLITIDLEKIVGEFEIKTLDIKEFLFMDLLLKEKDYRESLTNHNWNQYKDSILAAYCSTDAIIASWAYMLLVTHAEPFVHQTIIGKPEYVLQEVFRSRLDSHDWSQYEGKRVLLKGCSDKSIPAGAYAHATQYLQKYAERIMYGEACSFVPVWRKPKS